VIYYSQPLFYFLFMVKVYLRKIKPFDKNYFAKWWRDKELLRLTSGVLKLISDKEVDKYFLEILDNKNDYNFMVLVNRKVIGHISLVKRRNNWHETQIVIGEKKYWGKGFGSRAIKIIIRKARKKGIFKIYLEVRPTNTRAILAYEQCGFQKVKMVKYHNNKYLTETLRMELKTALLTNATKLRF